MKRTIYVAIILAVISSITLNAQTDKRLTKKEQKELNEKIDSLMFIQGVQAIKNKQFTIEADKIISKRGRTAYVSSNTNFVMVNGERATIQVAFSNLVAGPNGMGGITVEGSVSSYNIEESAKGNITLTMNVTGRGISARLDIYMHKGNNRATVDVSPNFNSNRITLSGDLIPNNHSVIFKGTTL